MMLETIVVGALQVNCYVLGCEESHRAVVIDPGDDAPAILAALKRGGLKLECIVITHAHFDHFSGARSLQEATGAPLYMHPDGQPLLPAMRRTAIAWLGRDPGEPPELTYDLSAGGLRVGELALEVRSTPGHAPGSLTLVDHTKRRAFTGDALFAGSIGRTDLPGGSLDMLLSNIHEQILVLPDDYAILPGHGPDSTIGEERRSNPFLAELPRSSAWRCGQAWDALLRVRPGDGAGDHRPCSPGISGGGVRYHLRERSCRGGALSGPQRLPDAPGGI